MYCYKCGNELRPGAGYCDKCGARQEKSKAGLWILGITLLIVGVILIVAGIFWMRKDPGLTENIVAETTQRETATTAQNAAGDTVKDTPATTQDVASDAANDVATTTQDVTADTAKDTAKDAAASTQDATSDVAKESGTSEEEAMKQALLKLLGEEEEPMVELPSLVTYSKNRLSLGEYKEDKLSGGYVQYFNAGSDTSIVQCIAEYKDMVAGYDLQCTGTLSSAEDGYNYTCYMFTYTGDADIELQSINFNDAGKCDMCFVTAVKDGDSYIAAYIPEGVGFVESSEHMRNSY